MVYSARRNKIKSFIRIENIYVRECLAEYIGTFFLAVSGCAAGAMAVLPPQLNDTSLSVNVAGAFGVGIGIWISGGVSGGHINPAVTLAFATIGRLPFRKVPIYWLGQYLGAFTAAFFVHCIYNDALNDFDGGDRNVFGPNATAQIWTTYPQSYVSTFGAFVDPVLSTSFLMLCILAVTDEKNMAVPKSLIPAAVAILMVAIGMSFSGNCGGPVNPARDLAPRAYTALAGWGSDCFTAYNNYWWIPVVGPHVGTILGAFVYLLMIEIHWPQPFENQDSISLSL